MKYNRHLKAIGLKKKDIPSYWFEGEERQKEDKDGFREVEFYDLDKLFSCFIYSYLCEFRENHMYSYPGSLRSMKEWEDILDKMIKAFKLKLTVSYPSKNQQKQINYGMRLFIKYYRSLWY